jgi:hypothetical protein
MELVSAILCAICAALATYFVIRLYLYLKEITLLLMVSFCGWAFLVKVAIILSLLKIIPLSADELSYLMVISYFLLAASMWSLWRLFTYIRN